MASKLTEKLLSKLKRHRFIIGEDENGVLTINPDILKEFQRLVEEVKEQKRLAKRISPNLWALLDVLLPDSEIEFRCGVQAIRKVLPELAKEFDSEELRTIEDELKAYV